MQSIAPLTAKAEPSARPDPPRASLSPGTVRPTLDGTVMPPVARKGQAKNRCALHAYGGGDRAARMRVLKGGGCPTRHSFQFTQVQPVFGAYASLQRIAIHRNKCAAHSWISSAKNTTRAMRNLRLPRRRWHTRSISCRWDVPRTVCAASGWSGRTS